ncbi:MAG TPA: hypothetical protein VF469_10035 [Kofleriaceae bacterium]
MNVRVPIWILMACAVTACAVRAAGPTTATVVPPPSQQVLATKVVAWSRDMAPRALPAQVKRVQLILTPGWAEDEHYAWLISDGTELVAVYRCTAGQRGEILDVTSRLVMPVVGTPLDKIAFGVLGSIKPPPPPPPGPGGEPGLAVERLPQAYVQGVRQAAWNLNAEQQRIEGAATAAVP